MRQPSSEEIGIFIEAEFRSLLDESWVRRIAQTVLKAEGLAAPYEVCTHHLEGLTFGRAREDLGERVDEFLALAECLREKDIDFDMNDPTAETLKTWLTDFRVEFDWDDPEAMAAYEECTSID